MRRGRITTLTIVLLAFIIAVTGNAGITRAFADAMGKVDYVADVQVFQGGTITECQQQCERMGYTPTNINLNEGAMEKVPILWDDPAPCVMLGYKTTNHRSLALTGVSVLHMGEGYEMRDFQAVAASLLSKNKNLAESMAAAACEFQVNYDLGAPCAVLAFRLLDLLYVDALSNHSFEGYTNGKKYGNGDMMELDECKQILDKHDPSRPHVYDVFSDDDDHESLAYYILDGNADAEFFAKLISYGTPTIVGAVHKALVTGSAEYDNSYNPENGEQETKVWAERLRDGDAKRMIEGGLTTDQWRTFDGAYMDAALDLVTPIQNFATLYLDAKARGASATDFTNVEGLEDLSDAPERGESLKEGDLDWIYICAYEMLNKYHYDDETLLGDWIVGLGTRTDYSDEDLRRLYPLVDAITPAQIALLCFSGFENFVMSMNQPNADDPSLQEAYDQIEAQLKEFVEGTGEWRICVWDGVDNSVYNGTVGMTSDVIRIAGANAVLQPDRSKESWQDIKRVVNWTIGIGTGLLGIASMIASQIVSSKASELLAIGVTTGVASIGGGWATLASVASFLSKLSLWIMVIEIAVAVVTVVAAWLYDKFSDPTSDYKEIPTLMYDTKTTKSGPVLVRYNAVWEPLRARVADTNAYVGYEWNVLYVTRDPEAGTPIVVKEGRDPFVLKAESSIPDGYVPATLFGQRDAADLNSGAYDTKGDRHNHLFYTTEGSLEGAEGALNEGEESKDKGGLYIADIVLATGEDAEHARAKIVSKKGKYYMLDRNFGTSGTPVYLGYSLTSVEKDALRDIRVFAESSDTEVSFGQARYALAGSLANGDGLYISRSELVGTPIRDGLVLVDNREKIPEGFEPVVYGSGAPVYMFGSEENPYAMYFEPKVKFTEGETYVAGIGFITGETLKGDKNANSEYMNLKGGLEAQEGRNGLDDVLWQARWQDGVLASDMGRYREAHADGLPKAEDKGSADLSYAVNMMSGLTYSDVAIDKAGADVNTWNRSDYTVHTNMYMVLAFTHNPYRAIRDAGTFTSTMKNTLQIPAMFPKAVVWKKGDVEKTATGTYVACEEVASNVTRALYDIVGSTRGQHAYISRKAREGLDKMYAPPRVDGSDPSWKRSYLQLSGLYVLGPVEGLEPLKASDVVVDTRAYDSSDQDGDIGAVMPEGTYAIDGTKVSGEEFRSVQDLRFPYNKRAQNLSYPEFTDDEGVSVSKLDSANVQYSMYHAGVSDELYLYLRGKVHRPRYIASVSIGSYSEGAFRGSNPDVNNATLNAMERMADDVAYQRALANSTEVLPSNLSTAEGASWDTAKDKYDTATDDYGSSTSYIGVMRTDDPNKALRGLVLLEESIAKPGSAPLGTITVGGNTKYMLPNDSASFSIDRYDNQAYLYYSYNSASLPGVPMTELSVDGQAFDSDKSTVLFASETGENGKMMGKRMNKYIHCKKERGRGTYINGIYLGIGKGVDEALLDLLAQGATEAVIADLNVGGNPVVIGYRSMNFSDDQLALHARARGTASDPLRETIRDVVATVGEPLQETLVHDGAVYKPVRDLSLNGNRRAPEIYLYQCMDHYTIAYNRTQDTRDQLVVPSLMRRFSSPIVSMGVAYGDRVPYNASTDEWAGDEQGSLELWENLLTTHGERIDLNYGAVSSRKSLNIPDRKLRSDSLINRFEITRKIAEAANKALETIPFIAEPSVKTVADNRCYLFFHREDNNVKPGAEIVGGTLKDVVERGEIYGYGE